MDPLLSEAERSKLDSSDDRRFYEEPRFEYHVDEAFRETLRELFRDHLEEDTRVLDLMSSWVSHLPEEMEFEHVEGHGLNQQELEGNERLDRYFLQDLNETQSLPLEDRQFHAVLVTVSVQYLQYPGAVFSEIHRVLRPGGVLIVSFSNRMFPSKAIRAWRESSARGALNLVGRYVRSVEGFTAPSVVRDVEPGRDPFYAVLTNRDDE